MTAQAIFPIINGESLLGAKEAACGVFNVDSIGGLLQQCLKQPLEGFADQRGALLKTWICVLFLHGCKKGGLFEATKDQLIAYFRSHATCQVTEDLAAW